MLRRVGLPGRSGSFDVVLGNGAVTEVQPAAHTPQRLLLPAFADPHVHADRAFLGGSHGAQSLGEAAAAAAALRRGQSADDVRQRAELLFERALSYGTSSMRSHVDVDEGTGLRALEGVTHARARFGGALHVEMVAFANAALDPIDPAGWQRLEVAIEAGAELVGGAPALHPDPGASLDAILDLCVTADVPADLHVDEHTDPDRFLLERLADGVLARGLQGRVTASHCCALGSVPPDVRQRTIGKLVAARITVIVLPAQNLFLQDRSNASPTLRGVTPVRELLAAGVPVRFASDNVQDLFYPFGNADPLETAFIASLAAHVDAEEALLGGVADGRFEPRAGEPADLILINASSLRDALARRPGGRVVLKGGRVVATGEGIEP